MSEFFAWMADKTQKLSTTIADMLNRIPGVETAPLAFTGVFAEEMAKQAEVARKAADEAWRKPLPSSGITAFFDNVDKRVAASRVAFEEAAKQKAKLAEATEGAKATFGDTFAGIGGFIAKAATGLRDTVTDRVSKFASESGPIEIGLPPSASKGSREEFQAIAQAQNAETQQINRRHGEQIGVLGSIRDNIAKIIPTMGGAPQTPQANSGLSGIIATMTGSDSTLTTRLQEAQRSADETKRTVTEGRSDIRRVAESQAMMVKQIGKAQGDQLPLLKAIRVAIEKTNEVIERGNEAIGRVESAVSGIDTGGAV
ncbi:hypothetical protein [Stieleria mannarensis]|uniref:hypothetical protein n=1 Tax=Stieleria mannarensis TaxID=2755585 RepID=UPI0015FF8BA1|nr:hypothetical protein [Rhodopirellula sp. JC639]